MKFQSLSGFRVRCNARREECHPPHLRRVVSIPIGFSSTLQLSFVADGKPWPPVSIPIGFSSTLQLFSAASSFSVSCWFQSLSGFRVRCNTFASQVNDVRIMVSIPIGFSSTLQLCPGILQFGGHPGFNPYRVFEYVATSSWKVTKNLLMKFQSLSGFRVRCNGMLSLFS